MIEPVGDRAPIEEAHLCLQKPPRRTPDTTFIDKLRHILSCLNEDVAGHLADVAALSACVKARRRITGVPEQMFDGSQVCLDDALRSQIVRETVFSYLLGAVCLEAIYQASGLRCLPVSLYGVAPEMEAYGWYQPKPLLALEIFQLLDAYRLWPVPIDLASSIYQRSLAKTERKAFGQYYTPPSIADHLLTQAGYHADNNIANKHLLDVAIGFGVFLARAALRLVQTLQGNGCSNLDIFRIVGQNLQGYDMQPFAVIATKMHVLMTVVESLQLAPDGIHNALAFIRLPQVRVADTVAQAFESDDRERPHYVVGNPPYGVCKSGSHLARYADVLDGRVNLYQLFLYFAVQRCAAGGTIAFLMPESLRSGRFFLALRRFLASHTQLVATTDFHARQSLFPDVEQGVLILAVRKGGAAASKKVPAMVEVVQTADEKTLATTESFVVPIEHVQMGDDMRYMLFKAANKECYALLHKLCHLDASLPRVDLKVHTGRLVWNRQRDHLYGAEKEGRAPVIYAPSIRRYAFAFPPETNSVARQHLLYGKVNTAILDVSTSGQVILVQRTTSRDQSRRIIATKAPYWFTWRHTRYLIENHVNYIDSASCNNGNVPLSYVLGLLNSNLLNFLFAALSGTTQVSAWELQALPLVYNDKAPLASLASRRLAAQGFAGAILDREIDNVVYDLYGLTVSERELVDTFHTYNHSSIGRRIERIV